MKTTLIIATKFMLLMTFITGVLYPLSMTGLAQLLFPHQARGSLVQSNTNQVIGSELLAQGFHQDRYFWPRPSATDYSSIPSGGSNLGPTSQALRDKVQERKQQGLTNEMLFASASGLDPHISKNAALAQLNRVAQARGCSHERLMQILGDIVEPRQLGFLGEERVNVLKLNLRLDQLLKTGGA